MGRVSDWEPTGFSHILAFSEVQVDSDRPTIREGISIVQAEEGDLTALRGSGFMGILGPRVWVLPFVENGSIITPSQK